MCLKAQLLQTQAVRSELIHLKACKREGDIRENPVTTVGYPARREATFFGWNRKQQYDKLITVSAVQHEIKDYPTYTSNDIHE